MENTVLQQDPSKIKVNTNIALYIFYCYYSISSLCNILPLRAEHPFRYYPYYQWK